MKKYRGYRGMRGNKACVLLFLAHCANFILYSCGIRNDKIRFSIARLVRIEIELERGKKRNAKCGEKFRFFFFSTRNFPRKLEIDDAAIKRNVFKLARRFLIYTLMIFLID